MFVQHSGSRRRTWRCFFMRSKFIQIALTDAELYALDDQGRVWSFQSQDQEWEPLPTTREGEKPLQTNG